jgi:flagellar hook-basal body complex protein FliE
VINKTLALDTFHQSISTLSASLKGVAAKNTKFQDLLQHRIKDVSVSEIQAQSLAHQFAIGAEDVSIHQVMIAAQKSLIKKYGICPSKLRD